jgi:two-component system NtrC family sensor kinase
MEDVEKRLAEKDSFWQIHESLSARLSETTKLSEASQIALQSILEMTEHSGGLLLVNSTYPNEPPSIISHGLSKSWSEKVQAPEGSLLRLAHQLVGSGQYYPADDLNDEPYASDNIACALPIAVDQSAFGVVMIEGALLSKEEFEQIQSLLPMIARSLHSTRRLGDIQERAKELASMQTELTHLGFSVDNEVLQRRMLEGALRLLGSETGAIILLDEKNPEWMVRKTLGDRDDWSYQINPLAGKGLVRSCLNSGEIVLAEDPSSDTEYDPSSDALGDLDPQSMICAPLIVDGQVLGAIQIINKISGGNFDAFDHNLISIIAALTANAMQGTRLIQKLKIANADLEASRWELLHSRNTLRALFDNLPTALYIVDPEYRIMAVNRGRAKLTDQPPKSLVGKTCYQALFNRSTPCPECRVQETFKDKSLTQRKESRQVADESTEWEISTYPISDEEGEVIQVILLEQDISEQHRLEGILAQSEKLAAIGQLAAGVAHEINNPLTAIIANAQILDRELPADSDLKESVDLIARAGARATQVVRNLLDFARKETYHLGLTDVNETMQRSLDLMQHEILARSVTLKYDPEPNLPTILASQDHLQSVWLNLVLNAIDALDNSPGSIQVTTRKIGDEILVSVADTGKGITPERLTRIFEPFYTTKEPGRGTGLGLSVCHRIVKQHGGHIRVESQLGAGSEFTVILPVS